MSIYIKGMEMPTDCTECWFRKTARHEYLSDCQICPFTGDTTPYLTRDKKCPLVPVHDHGRQDGLYVKYFVIKTETGEIVQDCFVLRPQKDKAAVAALLLYAEETESQELASDIRGWLSTIIPAEEGEG